MRRIVTRGAALVACLLCGGIAVSPAPDAPAAAAATGTQVVAAVSPAPRIPVGPRPAVAGAGAPGWRSRNWSGYAVTRSGITSVTGHWNVPQVLSTAKSGAQFSSDWVGIDGFDNSDLIQAGTEEDWIGGSAYYSAWWEILPSPETPIASMTVRPGDAMSVAISQGAHALWTITMTDASDGQSFTTHQSYAGPGRSAEWVHEAPSIGSHIATLTDDSPVSFDLGTIDGASPGLVTAGGGAMVKGKKVISIPSAPDADGDGFTVAFGHSAPNAPAS